MKRIPTRIENRYALSQEWTADNPILLEGEWGIESDTGLSKLGNGVSTWKDLAYFYEHKVLLNKILWSQPSSEWNASLGTEQNKLENQFFQLTFDFPVKRARIVNAQGAVLNQQMELDNHPTETPTEGTYGYSVIIRCFEINAGQEYTVQVLRSTDGLTPQVWTDAGKFYIYHYSKIECYSEDQVENYVYKFKMIDINKEKSLFFDCDHSTLDKIVVKFQLPVEHPVISVNGIEGGVETIKINEQYRTYQKKLGKIRVEIKWD